MDLNEVFGDKDPVTYYMGVDSLYSENFVTLRFGDGFLSDLSVLKDFFADAGLDAGDVDLIFNSGMEHAAFDSEDLRLYDAGNRGYGRSEYYFVPGQLERFLDYFSDNCGDAQMFCPSIRGENFVLGLATSWVVFYSPDAALVERLRWIAAARYGFIHTVMDSAGHEVRARSEDDLGVSFLSKAPLQTINYLPGYRKPKNWRAFPEAGLEILNFRIRELENAVRFHVDIEDAAVELRSVFGLLGVEPRADMVYHGVIARNSAWNFLLSEVPYNENTLDNEMLLQSFAVEVLDVPGYYATHQAEILSDHTVFFGDGFAFGSYEQGTDFVFFDDALRVRFESALGALGYEPHQWWWEKPEVDSEA